jgi:parvulin-like peptidyl-prolyl isomerase
MTDEQFMETLRKSGITLKHMEETEERKFFADEYLRSRVIPLIQRITREMLETYYRTHPEEFQQQDSVNWQDIFIAYPTKRNPTREHAYRFAIAIAARLRRGDDLAQLIDFDDGDSKARKGEGYGHLQSEISPPELARVLFDIREGEVGPIVEIPTGFHIVRVTKRQFAGPVPFDEKTQKAINQKLRNEIAERESKRVLQELRSRAVVEKASLGP